MKYRLSEISLLIFFYNLNILGPCFATLWRSIKISVQSIIAVNLGKYCLNTCGNVLWFASWSGHLIRLLSFTYIKFIHLMKISFVQLLEELNWSAKFSNWVLRRSLTKVISNWYLYDIVQGLFVSRLFFCKNIAWRLLRKCRQSSQI